MPFKKAKRIRCINCGQFNHTQVECKRKAMTPTIRVTKRIRCEICGQFDHTQADCRRKTKISAMNVGKATTRNQRNPTVTLKRMYKTQNTCNRMRAAYSTRIRDGFRYTILQNNQSGVMTKYIPQRSTSSQDTFPSFTVANSSQTQSSMHDSLQDIAASQSTVMDTNLSNQESEANSILPHMASTDAQENVYKESIESSSWGCSPILTPEQILMLRQITDEMMMECADSEFTRAIHGQSAEVNKQDSENFIINQVPEVKFDSRRHFSTMQCEPVGKASLLNSDLKFRKPIELRTECIGSAEAKSIDRDDDQMNIAQHLFVSHSSVVKDMEINCAVDKISVPTISEIRTASEDPEKANRDEDVSRFSKNSDLLNTYTAKVPTVKREGKEFARITEEPTYFVWTNSKDESDSNLEIEEAHESNATDTCYDEEDEIEVVHENVAMTIEADKCIVSSSASTEDKTGVVNDSEQSISILLEFAVENSSVFNASEIAKLNDFRHKILNAKKKDAELSVSSLMKFAEENSAIFKDTDLTMLQHLHSKIHKIEIR